MDPFVIVMAVPVVVAAVIALACAGDFIRYHYWNWRISVWRKRWIEN